MEPSEMAQGDEVRHCQDCGKDYFFTARDREYFESRSFDPPKRCKECRVKKKKRFAEIERERDHDPESSGYQP